MSSSIMSKAELEKAQREELERQRQEKLRRIKAAIDDFHRHLSRCEAFIGVGQQLYPGNQSQIIPNPELESAYQVFKKTSDWIITQVKPLKQTSMPQEVEEIEAVNTILEKKLQEISAVYSKAADELNTRLDLYQKGIEELKNSKKVSEKLQAPGRMPNYCELDVFRPKAINVRKATVDSVIEECSDLINTPGVSTEQKTQLMQIAHDLQRCENHEVCQSQFAQYKGIRGNVRRQIRLFEDLYSQYCALAVEHQSLYKVEGATGLALKGKHEFTSLEELRRLVSGLDRDQQQENERKYIREQIQEVMGMERFGYKMARPIELRGSIKGEHYLFQTNSRMTGLHVYLSEGGTLMMEAVGVEGLTDQTYKDSEGYATTTMISDKSRQCIYNNQRAFCSLHPEIVMELQKRGILLQDSAIKAASPDSAKQLAVKGIGAKTSKGRDAYLEPGNFSKQKLESMEMRRKRE